MPKIHIDTRQPTHKTLDNAIKKRKHKRDRSKSKEENKNGQLF